MRVFTRVSTIPSDISQVLLPLLPKHGRVWHLRTRRMKGRRGGHISYKPFHTRNTFIVHPTCYFRAMVFIHVHRTLHGTFLTIHLYIALCYLPIRGSLQNVHPTQITMISSIEDGTILSSLIHVSSFPHMTDETENLPTPLHFFHVIIFIQSFCTTHIYFLLLSPRAFLPGDGFL